MIEEMPKEWTQWLPLSDWWYKTNTCHCTLQLTPYEVVYGQPPPIHATYTSLDSSLDLVDRIFQHKEVTAHIIKQHLQQAQIKLIKTRVKEH